MLGKGLESLIPKNGQSQNPDGDNSSQPIQPAQPLSQSQPQPRPSFVPPVQPVIQQAVPAQPITQKSERPPQSPVAKKDDGTSGSTFQIELDKIKPNPDQPRRHFDQDALNELANSIREFGLLQPIVVSKVEKEAADGIAVEYQIIAGERRYLAAKMLSLPRIPAIVRNIGLEREKLELGVIENIQRENLNPIEMARAFQRLQEEFRMTQREIAAKLGKSREVVANAVRLLDLPEYIQRAVENGEVSESNARFLIGIEDPAAQKRLLDEIVQNKLTTRDVRARVEQAPRAAGAPRRGRPPHEEVRLAPEVKALQDELATSLGAPVEISKTASNGKITITFFSEEELKNILEKLKNEGRF
jgi:ParB family transcriptional regulator, chromosome partitioning protein